MSRGGADDKGKYPSKIYSIDGVLIYQVDDGTTNTGKTPKGGVIHQFLASSMMATIANPIMFYAGNWSIYEIIDQTGHSKDLFDYYWTSYSRGTDGNSTNTQWHNAYLDGYIPLRAKSIYDPCPYLYRIPSNGTFNQFSMQSGWTQNSYLGGVSWNMTTLGESWFLGLGNREPWSAYFSNTGVFGYYYSGTAGSQNGGYMLGFKAPKWIYPNNYNSYARSAGHSVRCIEDCDPRADGTPASAGY